MRWGPVMGDRKEKSENTERENCLIKSITGERIQVS